MLSKGLLLLGDREGLKETMRQLSANPGSSVKSGAVALQSKLASSMRVKGTTSVKECDIPGRAHIMSSDTKRPKLERMCLRS
jgi:hypothetical protein